MKSKQELLEKAYNLAFKYEAEVGSCPQYEEFEKAGAHVDKCPSVSGNVARWAAEIIIDELKK